MTYLEDFKSHANSSPTAEVCGLVINFKGKAKYYACNNIASDVLNSFSIDPIDYAKYSSMGDILYICHSHINATEQPSTPDIVSCNSGKIPWIIYSLVTDKLHIEEPTGFKYPLFGRKYIFNSLDCWTFVVDLYLEELSIVLPVYKASGPIWYKDRSNNYFQGYAEEAGFERVTDNSIKKYDIILFNIGSDIANHAGVYYGNGIFAHHAANRLSCKEMYGGYWAKTTMAVYRYKKL